MTTQFKTDFTNLAFSVRRSEGLPDDAEIPTLDALTAWLLSTPLSASAAAETRRRATQTHIAISEPDTLEGKPARRITMGNGIAMPSNPRIFAFAAALSVRLIFGQEPDEAGNVQPFIDMDDDVCALVLESLHETWSMANEKTGKKLKHPIAPLIRAWLKRPREVEAHKGNTGVLHRAYGRIQDLTDLAPEQAALFNRGAFTIAGEQLSLLRDLAANQQGKKPMYNPPVSMFEGGGFNIADAPLEGRIATEMLLALDADGRRNTDGRPVALDALTLGEFGDYLIPSGFRVDRHSPHFDRLWLAMRNLEGLELFYELEDGLLQPVRPFFFPYRPVRSRKARFQAVLTLPPGNGEGAMIHKPTLRSLTNSGRQYRGYQTLAYVWNESARKGKTLNPYQPRIRRNAGGQPIDIHGAAILDRQGKPISIYAPNGAWDARIVFENEQGKPVPLERAALVDNDGAWHFARRLDADDLIDIFNPRGKREQATPSQYRKMKLRALESLKAFEKRGIIAVKVTAVNQRGQPVEWKTLPIYD